MTKKKKKSSKTAPSQLREDAGVVEEEKPSSASKKPGSEIDEIFAAKKRKKPESKKKGKSDDVTKSAGKTKTMMKKKKNKKPRGSDDGGYLDAPSRSRKKTADGLTIYTEEELGLDKADVGGGVWETTRDGWIWRGPNRLEIRDPEHRMRGARIDLHIASITLRDYMDSGPRTYHAHHAEPAPTAVIELEEDGEIEPEDEEEEPAAEPNKEYVLEEGFDSDSDLKSGS